MTPTKLSLSEAIQRLLAMEGRGPANPSRKDGASSMRLYEKLARHLSPAVGEAGLDALFSRSVKITKRAFASLREVETTGSDQRVLEQFFEQLEKHEPAAAAAITESLMTTFVGMLSTFIGQDLTWQLLRNAWPGLPSEPPSEEKTK